mmetsp:Transcript_73093/g.207118  ORF Transcript_73093/g.207118 Transcript_73093/m.207118 type:complete len:259 (+) Transcript_73093:568-1344(+)
MAGEDTSEEILRVTDDLRHGHLGAASAVTAQDAVKAGRDVLENQIVHRLLAAETARDEVENHLMHGGQVVWSHQDLEVLELHKVSVSRGLRQGLRQRRLAYDAAWYSFDIVISDLEPLERDRIAREAVPRLEDCAVEPVADYFKRLVPAQTPPARTSRPLHDDAVRFYHGRNLRTGEIQQALDAKVVSGGDELKQHIHANVEVRVLPLRYAALAQDRASKRFLDFDSRIARDETMPAVVQDFREDRRSHTGQRYLLVE